MLSWKGDQLLELNWISHEAEDLTTIPFFKKDIPLQIVKEHFIRHEISFFQMQVCIKKIPSVYLSPSDLCWRGSPPTPLTPTFADTLGVFFHQGIAAVTLGKTPQKWKKGPKLRDFSSLIASLILALTWALWFGDYHLFDCSAPALISSTLLPIWVPIW